MTNTSEATTARISRYSITETIGPVLGADELCLVSTDRRKGDSGFCFPFHIAQWHVLLVGSLRPQVKTTSAMRLFISKINTKTLEYL